MTKTLVPLPDTPYYLWQALVQMYVHGHKDSAWIFYCPTGKPSNLLQSIMVHLSWYDIQWYPDWYRKGYNAAAKPGLIARYLKDNPDTGPNLIIDPDVIKTGRPLPVIDDNAIIGTDTDSYTGPKYLKKKGAWTLLCSHFQVDPEEIFWYEGIGAQYISDLPGEFWDEVSRESVRVYHMLKDLPSPDGVPVQAWCAEMYTTQMVAIREGVIPRVSDQMSMVWADGPIEGWDTAGFFHDAGVPETKSGSFCKIDHQSWPHSIPPTDNNKAAFRYVSMIQDTKRAWPHLVNLFPWK